MDVCLECRAGRDGGESLPPLRNHPVCPAARPRLEPFGDHAVEDAQTNRRAGSTARFRSHEGEHHRAGPDGESGAHVGGRPVGALSLVRRHVAVARLAVSHFAGRGRIVDEHAQRLRLLSCFVFLLGDEPDVGGNTGMAGVTGEHYELY